MNRGVFREYDIRGLADSELTTESVRLFGEALGRFFFDKGEHECLVGRDGRLSSPRIAQALIQGLGAAGLSVVELGTCTTPLFYFSAHQRHFKAGVMVTASHNPPEYNGFKVWLGSSTIHGAQIQALADLYEFVASAAASAEEVPYRDEPQAHLNPLDPLEIDAASEYVETLAGLIKLGTRPLRVGVDCGNGAAGPVTLDFLRMLGCEAYPLYCEIDGRFPYHEPDPTRSANLADLRNLVLAHGLDLGLAFDGDGDRIGVVDDLGRVIWGDTLMVLYWREILSKHPGAKALVEVKCSQALVDEVSRLGGQPFFHKTGHSLIKATMAQEGLLFAGEMSGHMFFADEYFGFDDALYAAGRLLRLLSHEARPLSAIVDEVPKYWATAETRITCPDEVKAGVVEKLARELRRRYEVITVDGARVLFDGGWGLVRHSNTQPVLVARCEGRTPETLCQICEVMARELAAFPEVPAFEWEF